MRRASGAWGVMALGVALGAAAGGCATAGSFEPGTLRSGFAFAGDNPFCQADARVWTLPTAVDVPIAVRPGRRRGGH